MNARLAELESVEKKSEPRWTEFSMVALNRNIVATCSCGDKRLVRIDSVFTSKSCKCRLEFKSIHGGTGTDIYNIWCNIKARTENPQHPRYKDYGGRGITLYKEWSDDFAKFRDYIGERPSKKHSIDRIDNDKGYIPNNVRWATPTVQRTNSRRVRLIEHNGESLPLKTMCDKYGINRATFKDRLKAGWTIADALETPPMPSGHKRTMYNQLIA